MAPFEEINTKRATEAVSALMEHAFFATPEISEAEVIQEYKQVGATWHSKELFKGSPSKVTELILRNLEEYEKDDRFQHFGINVYPEQKCAQVSAIFRNFFFGVRVWRTAAVAFVCGNAGFRSDPVGYADREALNGNTTVLKALQDKRPGLAKDLIAQKGDLQQRDDYGNTAIHYAAALGYLDVLQELLRRGVDPETRNHQGQIPLVYAMEYRQFKAAKILWRHRQETIVIRSDSTAFKQLVEELCAIGVDCSWEPGENDSGFYQLGSTPDEKYIHPPRVIEIGETLNKLGGIHKMQEAAQAVQEVLGRHVIQDLSWAWHGIGDWMA